MSLLSDIRNILAGREFCESCGSPMSWSAYGSGFDRITGRPVTRERWQCSKDGSHWEYKRRYREVSR